MDDNKLVVVGHLLNGTLKLPTPSTLPLSEEDSYLLHPIVLVGDDAIE